MGQIEDKMKIKERQKYMNNEDEDRKLKIVLKETFLSPAQT